MCSQSNTTTAMYLAKTEFQRVQTYLFSSETLKSMVGANTLLGEAIRGRRPEQDPPTGDDDAVFDEFGLFGLALKYRGDWKPTLPQLSLPGADAHDPLGTEDDPASNWSRGVMVRDGGRFHALFPDRTAAEKFIRAVGVQVQRRLPGLRFVPRINELAPVDGKWTSTELATPEQESSGVALLPMQILQQCAEIPSLPATKSISAHGTTTPISHATDCKHQAEDRFRDSKSFDVIGLLKQARKLPLADNPPNDFSKIAAKSGYLAVIHADGNDMGTRSKEVRGKATNNGPMDFFELEAQNERFFHSMRVATRKAVCGALTSTFDKNRSLYRLLMLGGDDLLLVCDASLAVPFLTAYGQELAKAGNLADGKPLTVGAGVAIGHHNYPMHRLHDLAEDLASQAKASRRARVQKDGKDSSQSVIPRWVETSTSDDQEKDANCGPCWEDASVVNWLVSSDGNIHDPDFSAADHVHEVILPSADKVEHQQLFLHPGPWPFGLNNGDGEGRSLDWLWQQATRLCDKLSADDQALSRSQLKGLAQNVGEGRRSADHRVARMAEGTHDQLANTFGKKNGVVPIWRKREGGNDESWETALRDLVILFDLAGGFTRRGKNAEGSR